MLEGIDTKLNYDFFAHRNELEEISDRIVFTGAIDEFYRYRFGKLEYRTVNFETELLNMSNYQGNAVINYTEKEIPYTRVIEHKHFEMFGADIEACSKTVISKEYSSEWKEGSEPYYPVNDEKNNSLYLKYKKLADQDNNVILEVDWQNIDIMICIK